MNIVIPMAGRGDRMRQAGYTDSKPMIDVMGKPMIQHVVQNIGISDATYIFIVQKEDRLNYGLDTFLPAIVPFGANAEIVELDGVTEGAAVSVLQAKNYIDNYEPLMIVNSDQLIEWDIDPFDDLEQYDGCIYVFSADCPKFSYASVCREGKVVEVAEKRVISDLATAGAYYWSFGCDFVTAALAMITANDRTNGEFYTAPVYNYATGDNVIVRNVNGVSHLGTPEELEEFLERY